MSNSLKNNENIPLVSVLCQTYNHESFIRQCLDGIIMQKTNFGFEVLVHDDASTDKTANIIREYEKKFSKIIDPIYQIENQYSQKKRVFARIQLPRARGKYIAICEGDDYWTDPFKLQKQVDFLEANPEFSFCCHRYKIYSQFNKTMDKRIFPLNFNPISVTHNGVIINKEVYHTNWLMQTLTTVIRTEFAGEMIKMGDKFKYFRDTHFYYYLLKYGNGICLDFVGGVYNQNEGGIYSGVKLSDRRLVDFLIFEELYLISKDIRFLNKYTYLAFHLLIRGQHISTIFKSFFLNLSFSDKINMLRARFIKE